MRIRNQRGMKRKLVAFIATAMTASLLALASPASAVSPSSPTTNRISGADRYATAVAMARSHNVVTSGIVFASGESTADALAASQLASATRPILLVGKDSVPASVTDFISDYKSTLAANTVTIYFMGGESAISAATMASLTASITTAGDLTPPTFTRVSGADRYATAAAAAAIADGQPTTDKMIIVSGESWADGVSAGVLASEMGWPVVLQTKNGNNASAKSAIDTYLALPGSIKQFVIVGGESAISTDTTEYLVNTKGVAIANIRRIAGADRYATNRLVNTYANGQGGLTQVGAALASGESPWDALAASSWGALKNVMVTLTPAAGGNAEVATYATTLATAAKADVDGGNDIAGSTLYLLGGKNAVHDAVRTEWKSSAATNLTSTLTGCEEGSTTLTLTLSGALSTNEDGGFVTNGEGVEAITTKNGAALNAGATVAKKSAGVYTITLNAADIGTYTNANSFTTYKFAGVTEGVQFGGADTFTRSIGASSCSTANDASKPTVTLTVIAGTLVGNNGDVPAAAHYRISASEAIYSTNAKGAFALAANDIVCGGTGNTAAIAVVDVSAAGTLTEWIGTPADAEAGHEVAKTTAGVVCSLRADAVFDRTGNQMAADVSTTVVADATGAVATFNKAVCLDGASAAFTQGNLTITATNLKAYDGAVGNQWKMSVVNSRGLLQPMIDVDATAQMITVTVDTGYHTVEDVIARYTSLNGTSAWTVSGTGATTATLSPRVSASGTQTCTVYVDFDEAVSLNTGGVEVSVNGYLAGVVTSTAVTGGDSFTANDTDGDTKQIQKQVTFTTTQLGTGSLAFVAGATNATNMKELGTTSTFTFTVAG